MQKNRRKVCFIITSFIHYSRNFLILEALKNNESVELHIVLGGIVLSSKYASQSFNIRKILERDGGYSNIHEIHFNLDGDNQVIKAKTVGLGIVEFSSVFNEIEPDVVVLRGDRFEVLAAAVAAAHMNISIAHIEGGDVSGTLDESIRHAITKLAHIHFATNDPAYNRLLKMGERREYVFNFGSPDVEVAHKMLERHLDPNEINFANLGSGAKFDPNRDYVMVMFHPVNTELENLSKNTRQILNAVDELGMQILWFWPNFDAGAEHISHELRSFNDTKANHKIRFLRYVPPKQFLSILSKSKCLIGNSSAGIKECSYLGIPVVNVGTRQNSRLKAKNVIDCGYSKEKIKSVIKQQLKIGRYASSTIYHSNDTSKEIADVISSVALYTQKTFID
jgi:UDP-hydrolysing UDP-N-acetyl-D-glucosamine 2-epimerase